jgi:gamma-glutamylcyclotransferase (GGCT)/AIG2-like uncharacterized protein YtfP
MLIAVYGTLRKGDANDRYLRGYSPVSTERVEGFEMFNLRGAYPYIARGGDDITVEVYDVPEEVVAPIERMERGSGYEMCKVKTTAGIADIFYMAEEKHARYQTSPYGAPPKILSGDWFTWLKKYKPQRLSNNFERDYDV